MWGRMAVYIDILDSFNKLIMILIYYKILVSCYIVIVVIGLAFFLIDIDSQ